MRPEAVCDVLHVMIESIPPSFFELALYESKSNGVHRAPFILDERSINGYRQNVRTSGWRI